MQYCRADDSSLGVLIVDEDAGCVIGMETEYIPTLVVKLSEDLLSVAVGLDYEALVQFLSLLHSSMFSIEVLQKQLKGMSDFEDIFHKVGEGTILINIFEKKIYREQRVRSLTKLLYFSSILQKC